MSEVDKKILGQRLESLIRNFSNSAGVSLDDARGAIRKMVVERGQNAPAGQDPNLVILEVVVELEDRVSDAIRLQEVLNLSP